MIDKITALLGKEAEHLLDYKAKFDGSMLHVPSPDFIDKYYVPNDRPSSVIRSLGQLFNTGRLANTGYMSILPVDQGIEHGAISAFAPNPIYMDPENIVKLAIEGGCNACASTLGVSRFRFA
jgi:class I fructose-bisphosphate aldolase